MLLSRRVNMQGTPIFFDGWPKLERALILAALAYGALENSR